MNLTRTLKVVAFCGILGLSAAAMADTITLTVKDNGLTVGTYTDTSSSLLGNTISLSDLTGSSTLAASGFTISNLGVTGINDSATESELDTSARISATGAGTLWIEIAYSGFTLPGTTTTMGSSSSYTDAGIASGSTLQFQSEASAGSTMSKSPWTSYTLATGTNGSGASTASPVNFAQVGPYTLTQYYSYTSSATGGNLQVSGTTTAFNIPEGGAALAYLLLAAAACFGALRFGKMSLDVA